MPSVLVALLDRWLICSPSAPVHWCWPPGSSLALLQVPTLTRGLLAAGLFGPVLK